MEAGRTFDSDSLSPEMQTAVEDGMADAWAELDTFKKDKIDTGQVTSAQLFGTRQDLGGNYLYRMAGAVLGIYGNTAAEAIYPAATDRLHRCAADRRQQLHLSVSVRTSCRR